MWVVHTSFRLMFVAASVGVYVHVRVGVSSFARTDTRARVDESKETRSAGVRWGRAGSGRRRWVRADSKWFGPGRTSFTKIFPLPSRKGGFAFAARGRPV